MQRPPERPPSRGRRRAAWEEFPEVVNRAAYGKERTIVAGRGKDMAAVISMYDLRLPGRLARVETDRIDLKDARAAL